MERLRMKMRKFRPIDAWCLNIFTLILYWDEKRLIDFLQEHSFYVQSSKKITNIVKFLQRVIQNKDFQVFRKFLDLLVDPSLKFSNEKLLDTTKSNFLMECTRSTEHFYVVLSRAREQNDLHNLLSQKDVQGHTCFMRACSYGNIKVVKMLLENFRYDWDPQKDLDRAGNSVLMILSQKGHVHIVIYLLDKARSQVLAASQMINPLGQSFLSEVCATGNTDMLQVFIPFLHKIFVLPDFGQHFLDCMVAALESTVRQKTSIVKQLLAYLIDTIEKKV